MASISISATDRVFVLTGAGISAESGLPTFRASDGLWAGHRIEDVCTPEALERNPALVWQFYSERRASCFAAQPNPAHIALYGQQLGTKYFVTGKVYTNDERTDDKRRVQYFFFMQVIEVQTSAIRWQHKAYVTKEIR